MQTLESVVPPKWVEFDSIKDRLAETVEKAKRFEWWFFRNPNGAVKYVNIRIDMRDGNCLIKTDCGKVLTIEELMEQTSR